MKKKTYIIAEVGVNHNGSLDLALKYIDQLSLIKIDAIKFQLSIPDNLHSNSSIKAGYQKERDKHPDSLSMSRSYALNFNEHKILYERCREKDIDYLCSAFDLESLKFLDSNFDLRYFKIPSGEIFSLDSLEYIAKRKKPILMSTGMASMNDIELATKILNQNFNKDIVLLHCVSRYPAPLPTINLRSMLNLKKCFGYDYGYSDHTVENEAAVAAVALGATVIEKHVTLDKYMSGPDHQASCTVEQFENLVISIRRVEDVLGEEEKYLSADEMETRKVAYKSIVAAKNICKGDLIDESSICFKRPGTGLSPLNRQLVIGREALVDIYYNDLIQLSDLK